MNYLIFKSLTVNSVYVEPDWLKNKAIEDLIDFENLYQSYQNLVAIGQFEKTSRGVKEFLTFFLQDFCLSTHPFKLKPFSTLEKTPQLIEKPLRALWWKQPYGNLMLEGKIETRSWDTKYRGLVLICASKNPYPERLVHQISGYDNMLRIKDALQGHEILNGVAIAVGELIDVRLMRKSDEEKAFVKYSDELFSHIYQNVSPIKPFPLLGCQGWKTMPVDVWDKIEFI